MSLERLRWLKTRAGRLLRRRKDEAELEAELRFHLEQLAAEFRAEGMSEAEARLAAQREFGGTAAVREEIWDTWRPAALADFWRSVRFALRSLARSPGFTVLATLTLALGIGANTSMFSIIENALFKPLPYVAAGQLDEFYRVTPQTTEGAFSPADFGDFRREAAAAYQEVAAYAFMDASLARPGQPPDLAPALRVSADFLRTLGIAPALGRDFGPSDDRDGGEHVLLISARCWRDRFAGAPDVIGRIVRVNGEPHEIIGVLPDSFNDWRHLGWVDLMRPLALTPAERTNRAAPMLRLVGRRLASRVPAEAAAFVGDFGQRMATDHPAENAGSSWRVVRLEEATMNASMRSVLYMLVGLSAFVLLIACSNLANFLLARTMGRAREYAVRGALGASRLQLLRPLILEALMLALAGGAGAIVVATWFIGWMNQVSTGDNGEGVAFSLNWTVFLWACGASLFTALAFGLAPALFALRLDLNETLKSGGRGAVGGPGHVRLRHALIVGQFALAMVLLGGATLFIRGLEDLNNRRAGWESDELVAGTIFLPDATYAQGGRSTQFHRLVLERLESIPGVRSASLSSFQPFFKWFETRRLVIEGRDVPEAGREPAALVNVISPHYFETVRTPLLRGRTFGAGDTAEAGRVCIVSESMARGLFGGDDPIGRSLAPSGPGTRAWMQIVGVAADVRSISPDPVPVAYQMYVPLEQEPRLLIEVAVRAAGVDPAVVVAGIRDVVTGIDPDLPVRDLKPAGVRIARANYQLGVLRDMLAGFAVLGIGLASMGIYGVIARLMALRTNEFGLRLALGAQVGDIARMVLATGVRLALAGAVLGMLGAWGVCRLLASAFPNMRLESLSALMGSAGILAAVAMAACLIPARRAGRISPVSALRAE